MFSVKEYTLEQLCDITDGSHFSPEAVGSGYPMLSVKDMREYGFNYESCKKISKESFEDMIKNNCVPQKGDVLVAKDGSYLKEIFVQNEYHEEAILSSIAIFRPNKELITSDFLCYSLKSPYVLQYIRDNCVSGSAIPRIVLKSFKKVKLQIPDLVNQKLITSLIKTYDDRIRCNNQINDYLLQLVDTVYSECINNYSTGQDIRIGSISKIYSGGTPQTSEESYWGGEFNWLSSGETRNRFINHTEKTITQQGIDNSSTKKAYKNDIVIASAGQGLTRGQTSLLTVDSYVNQSIIVIHPFEKFSAFIFANLSKRYDELRSISDSSSIRGSITTGMISDLTIPELSKEGLECFNKVAKTSIELITRIVDENSKLSSIRDTLLPKLMSGEIDVSKLELNS